MAFIGEIRMMAFAPPPPGWVPCNGQTLRIVDHPLLYSELRETFGGDGHSTFALPDLRGRVPVHVPSALRGSSLEALVRLPEPESSAQPTEPCEAGATPVTPYLTLSLCINVAAQLPISVAWPETEPIHPGEIRLFAGDFDPIGWMSCEGQTLSPAEHPRLFEAIGTTYGGDGESSFALPDLCGRVPVHEGDGFVLGDSGTEDPTGLEVTTPPACLRFLIAVDVTTPSELDRLIDDDSQLIGEVRLFASEQLPERWLRCDGLRLTVMQNTALCSIVGGAYEGPYGRSHTSFALPDLSYAAPRHPSSLTVRTRVSQDATAGDVAPHPVPDQAQLPGTLGLTFGIAIEGRFPPRA